MVRNILTYIMPVITVVMLNGCVSGKHAYHDVILDIKAKGMSKLAVATFDQRNYIIVEKKTPDFVGLQRGGYGNPFSLYTVSGRPLSEDMTTSLEHSLQKQGFDVIPVMTDHSDSVETVMSKMSSTGAHRLLLLVLYEWKADTYCNTALIYDVTLKIMDNTGRILVKKTLVGHDIILGGNFFNPKSAERIVPVAFKEKIEMLLNNQDVMNALMENQISYN